MSALTLEQLKSLAAGDWVWVVILDADSVSDSFPKQSYFKLAKPFGEGNYCYFMVDGICDGLHCSGYGTKWLAYKNKEMAEGGTEKVVREFAGEVFKELTEFLAEKHITSANQVKQIIRHIKERYENKEQAEAKSEIVELPCKIETLHVGDTVYYIQEYFNDATLKHERQVKRTIIDHIAKDYIEVNNGVWLLADKFWLIPQEAERRLAELTKE